LGSAWGVKGLEWRVMFSPWVRKRVDGLEDNKGFIGPGSGIIQILGLSGGAFAMQGDLRANIFIF
jgi:hypothetical protein